MEASERDSTQDWLLPESARPPLLSELETRIDEAIVTARASEAAVTIIGAAALDAAEQARRAADLAQRASAAMLDRSGGVEQREAREEPPLTSDVPQDESLRSFTARADRIARRLWDLERTPLPSRVEVTA